ncbi:MULTISPECIES: ornithine cyclodeaminase [unclassified Micromonospora]|uniref:ornithine cyclodeaminase n=1 Tax=unclassified Micromonospora TaxID=2617518 RepID=UPI0022C1D585|nr:ornithine cyclodeaminase [Micromonospora sp. AKA38]GHJ17387.1 ornithine cyclodeaminase [Micromonospora sp. AKA38]
MTTSVDRWFTAGLPGLRGPGSVAVLSRADVLRCLDALDVVALVRRTLADHDAGRCVLPGEAYLRWDNSRGAYTRSIGMPGAVPGAYGMKIINASVSNPEAGLERAGGVGLCFDPETARIMAVVEVGIVSAVRTAAVSALAVDLTGHADAESLTVLGCGAQGGTHAALLLETLPRLSRVTLHDHVGASAHGLAQRLRRLRPELDVRVTAEAATAVAASQVTIATTTADAGYLPPAWIPAGALVVNVSLADLTVEALLAAGALYVDDVDLVAENPRRPLGALMAQGRVTRPGSATGRAIDGTIGGLVTGRHRLVRTDSFTVVNPFGMGVLDVALIEAVRRHAVRTGLGSTVDLG